MGLGEEAEAGRMSRLKVVKLVEVTIATLVKLFEEEERSCKREVKCWEEMDWVRLDRKAR